MPKQFWRHLCKYCTISHRIVTVEKLFRGLFATQHFVIPSALERLNEIRESRLCDYIHGNRRSRIYPTISRIIRYVSNNQKSTNKRIAIIKNILFCFEVEKIVCCTLSRFAKISAYNEHLSVIFRFTMDAPRFFIVSIVLYRRRTHTWAKACSRIGTFLSKESSKTRRHHSIGHHILRTMSINHERNRHEEREKATKLFICQFWSGYRTPLSMAGTDDSNDEITQSMENDWNFPETLFWFISAWREFSYKGWKKFYKAWKKFITRQVKNMSREQNLWLKIKQNSTRIFQKML